MTTYDKRDFFDAIQQMYTFQVGKEYYFLFNGKITKGVVCETKMCVRDPGLIHITPNRLTVGLDVIMKHGERTDRISVNKLFESREEAAEHFLRENDVPSELLKVLKQEKPKTTVADLIAKLQDVDPELDLAGDFWKVLNPITRRILPVETTDKYWDCECDVKYVHPVSHYFCKVCGVDREGSPSSKLSEVIPENIADWESI